jgi:hypothetical protein
VSLRRLKIGRIWPALSRCSWHAYPHRPVSHALWSIGAELWWREGGDSSRCMCVVRLRRVQHNTALAASTTKYQGSPILSRRRSRLGANPRNRNRSSTLARLVRARPLSTSNSVKLLLTVCGCSMRIASDVVIQNAGTLGGWTAVKSSYQTSFTLFYTRVVGIRYVLFTILAYGPV